MFYNRRGIQKQIISERKERERLDKLSLNEWMSPAVRSHFKNASYEAKRDVSLSWEDMCNPQKSTWTANLKSANEDSSRIMFGKAQEGSGKPDKTASEAMHMAWKPKDYPNTIIPKDIVIKALQNDDVKITWATQFLAGWCWKTKFAKVNEIKGKVSKDEDGKITIDGKWSRGLQIISSNSARTTPFIKVFTYGDKYILLRYGFQNFVLMMIKDKNGKLMTSASDFERVISK